MKNADKATITKAIDTIGYEWQVSETTTPPLVQGEKIIIEETVVFTAKKRTEIPYPV
jgi:hypothetical protein